MSVNKVILLGHLGADPDLRYTQSQQPVATLSVATNKVWYNKENHKQEETEWHRVVLWGKNAESASKFLKKGSQVYIEGENKTRKWTDKNNVERYTTEVVGHIMRFCGASGGGQGNRAPHPGEASAPTQQDLSGPVSTQMDAPSLLDDIPF